MDMTNCDVYDLEDLKEKKLERKVRNLVGVGASCSAPWRNLLLSSYEEESEEEGKEIER
jgi:hypothetical protein